MKRPRAISLVVWPGVPADVAAAVGRALAVYPLVSSVRHRLHVEVVPAPAVKDPSGGVGFGVCGVPDSPAGGWRGRVLIAVAGLFADEYESDGGTRAEAVRESVRVLCHELAHYEQWRDGRELTERGANRRMSRLLEQIESATAHGEG